MGSQHFTLQYFLNMEKNTPKIHNYNPFYYTSILAILKFCYVSCDVIEELAADSDSNMGTNNFHNSNNEFAVSSKKRLSVVLDPA